MKTTLSSLIVPAGVTLGAIGLVVSSVPLYRSHTVAAAHVQAQAETFRSLDDLLRLTVAMEAAEAQQRGFLLTGDTADLLSYRRTVGEVARLLDDVRATRSVMEPGLRPVVARFDSLATRRVALLDSLVTIRSALGLEDARRAVALSGGMVVMAELRAAVATLAVGVEAQLEAQRQRLVGELGRGRRVLLFGSAASVLLILGMLGLLQHERASRRGAEDALARANRDLVERNEALSENRGALERQSAMLERQSAMLEGVIRNLAVAVVVADRGGNLLIVNPAAERILGVSATSGGLLRFGEEYELFLADGSAPVPPHQRPLARALRGEIVDGVEMRQRRKREGQRDVWVVVSARPLTLRDGSVIGGVVSFADVTVLKDAENALRVAKLAAEAANRGKTEFLANMSHELRTPLNGVIGMVDLALTTEDAMQRTRYLNGALSAADSLLEVINGILDFSRIEAGRVEIEEVDFLLRPLIEETLESFVGTAQQKGIVLTPLVMPDVPNALTGDPARIRQVLRNVVGNALKFTDHGAVVVRVDRKNETDTSVTIVLSVTDTGIGIPAAVKARIFKPFQQADASAPQRFGGSGLGLAIVAELVRLMSGRIRVESEVGQGSTFHIVLELRKSRRDAAPEPADAHELDGLRVLIVDDSDVSRVVVHAMLAAWRMRPSSARGAEQAQGLLRAAASTGEPFRLVVVDSHLRDADGFELTRRIRADAAFADLMVVMLTAAGRRGDAARCRELGIAAYLAKPVRQSDLLDAILTAYGRSAVLPRSRDLVTVHSIREQRGGCRVLVAEDNEFNQLVAQDILRRWGHEVTTVGTGAAAVQAAVHEHFDLILMDVDMPELDGIEATRAIRAYEAPFGRRVPIVAMTALAQPGDRDTCLAAGMDDYVAKPIRDADLVQVIERTLHQSRPPAPLAEPLLGAEPGALLTLDRERLLAEVGGDHDRLHHLADIFTKKSAKLLRRLRAALDAQDAAEVRNAAHALQDSIAFWGAGDAYHAALTVEAWARKGSLEKTHAEFIVLEAGLARLQAELDRLQRVEA